MTIEKMQRARELDGLIIDYNLILQHSSVGDGPNLKVAASMLANYVGEETEERGFIIHLLKEIHEFAGQKIAKMQKEFDEL
jgi:hypothetical protein